MMLTYNYQHDTPQHVKNMLFYWIIVLSRYALTQTFKYIARICL